MLKVLGFALVAEIGAGESEVEDLQLSIWCDLQVGRLEIAVDDVLFVRGFEALSELAREIECLVEIDGPPLQSFGEVLACDEFHHEEDFSFGFLQAVQGCDVCVIQRGEQACLAAESREAFRVLRELRRDHLDRDLAVEASVPCPVDLAHPALADFGGDLVVPDFSADQNVSSWPEKRRSLRPECADRQPAG